MPDPQTIWNALLGILIMALAGALRVLRDSLKDLQASDIKLAEKVQAIELLVAGKYVLREDLNHKLDRVFEKLDAIDAKLDSKVNRNECPILHDVNTRGGV